MKDLRSFMENHNGFMNESQASGSDKNNPILKYMQSNVLTDKMLKDWFKTISNTKIEKISWSRNTGISVCTLDAKMSAEDALDLANKIAGDNEERDMAWGNMLDQYYAGLIPNIRAYIFANNSTPGTFSVMFYLDDENFEEEIIDALPYKFPEFGQVGTNTDAVGQPIAVNDIVAYLPKGKLDPILAAITRLGRGVIIMTKTGNELTCKNNQIVKISQ